MIDWLVNHLLAPGRPLDVASEQRQHLKAERPTQPKYAPAAAIGGRLSCLERGAGRSCGVDQRQRQRNANTNAIQPSWRV